LRTPASPLVEALKIEAAEAASGGCIHDCYRVTIGGTLPASIGILARHESERWTGLAGNRSLRSRARFEALEQLNNPTTYLVERNGKSHADNKK